MRKSPAEEGVTAKVYAAYYGKWRKITDVYRDVYAGNAKDANTGRISECTRELLEAGLLESMKQKERWPLYRASMSWLYGEFEGKKAPLNDSDRQALEKVLFPPEEDYKRGEVPWFGLSREEAEGKRPFVPTPQKIRDFLHASVAFTLFLLGNPTAGLPKQTVESSLERIKRNLGMEYGGKAVRPAASAAQPQLEDEGLAKGPYAHSFAAYLLLRYRTAARDHDDPRHTLLYKLVHVLYDNHSAAALWKAVEDSV
ncbi:MAG: hypothetical protein V1787_04995 [Candidatus Micrarchaeota archaeon]